MSKGLVKRAIFNTLYIGKLVQNGPLNGHKMAKDALNELIFGPDVYFYGFYQFLKGFRKILKIGRFLAKKQPFSVFRAPFFWYSIFHGKCI